MSEAKNIRLDEAALAALQEAAARRHKTLDEMANEAVMEGLKPNGRTDYRRCWPKDTGDRGTCWAGLEMVGKCE